MTSWATRLVQPDPRAPDGFRSLVTPTARGSTTLFESAAALQDTWNPNERPYAYGLYGTPTTLELAARIADLERGIGTFVTPGGQAALVLVYLTYLRAGDHVLIPESIYGPSRDFAEQVLSRLGVQVGFYPPTIGSQVERLLQPNTRLLWCESPGSVTLEVQDVPAIAAAAHRAGALLAVDNTWSAGILFDAFAHGADVSIQAITKYIGGHSDLILGSVTARTREAYAALGRTHALLGLAASPDDCYLALRGMQTLAIRLAQVGRSALEIARWLASRHEIEIVLHPAMPTSPGHEIWRRDFTGSSGLFSIVFERGFTKARVHAFVDRLNLFRIGYSWGGVTSLAIPGAGETTRPDYPYDHRLVRISIGLEDPGDLIADLESAFAALG
jgi:cystathionine beta-lyase